MCYIYEISCDVFPPLCSDSDTGGQSSMWATVGGLVPGITVAVIFAILVLVQILLLAWWLRKRYIVTHAMD